MQIITNGTPIARVPEGGFYESRPVIAAEESAFQDEKS